MKINQGARNAARIIAENEYESGLNYILIFMCWRDYVSMNMYA